MKFLTTALLASTLAAVAVQLPAAPAAALPLAPAALAGEAARSESPVIPVSRSGRRLTAGILGGLIVGGLIASQWPYRYGYYPYQTYPAYPAYPAYRGYPVDSAIAYCMQRFRSYDPYSMTYLGYDGRRHPCP